MLKDLQSKANLLEETLKNNNELLKALASSLSGTEVKEAKLLYCMPFLDYDDNESIIVKLVIDDNKNIIKIDF